ncbi:MAG TPA: VOC family protein [Acidimicrobiales bacterium]|nr:VOC family protein [Acidimicrobiales bacterium]
MHRSALGAFGIDVPTSHVEVSKAFWRAALSRTSRAGTNHPEFEALAGTFSTLDGFLQDVGTTASRVHLDLHTDDLEAEVARLVGLGATEVGRHGGWAILEDPAGMAFCVIPVDADAPVLDGAPTYGT